MVASVYNMIALLAFDSFHRFIAFGFRFFFIFFYSTFTTHSNPNIRMCRLCGVSVQLRIVQKRNMNDWQLSGRRGKITIDTHTHTHTLYQRGSHWQNSDGECFTQLQLQQRQKKTNMHQRRRCDWNNVKHDGGASWQQGSMCLSYRHNYRISRANQVNKYNSHGTRGISLRLVSYVE